MFDYNTAFSRNIGWITFDEREKIKNTTVAIAGLGGAGGEHALTLARMGFQNFKISDFDEFEIHNFNRQAGAYMSSLNQPKCSTMAKMIRDVNPDSKVEEFPDGINKDNVDAFFDGVDIYVDGIDFFALGARKLVYQKALDLGIPNLLAAPIGMGAALAIFTKDSMSYQDYYQFNDDNDDMDNFIKLLIGLAPAMLHRDYLVDQSAANFKEKRGPSTPMAIKLCSGLLVSNVVKLVTGRGEVVTAPRVTQLDAYKNKIKLSWCPFGNKGPIQKLKFAIARKQVT